MDLELSASDFRKPEPEWTWLPRAERAGMRGVVLKSHWWPTVHAAAYLRALRPCAVELWSSVTLNSVVGGPQPWIVDSAARLGATVVFLPTWNSATDLAEGRWNERLQRAIPTFDPRSAPRYRFTSEDGRLTPNARELLALCGDLRLTLGTGHASWRESLALAEAARDLGYRRLVFDHPLSRGIDAPLDAVRRAAELGAWIELCAINLTSGRVTAAAAARWCRDIGVDHVVLSTDAFRAEDPSPPELLRGAIADLLSAGLTAEEVRIMTSEGPALALGLE